MPDGTAALSVTPDRGEISGFFDQQLNSALDGFLTQQQPSATFFGQSIAQAITLDRKLQTTASRLPRLMDLRKTLEAHDIEELAAAAQIENVAGIAAQASHIKAARLREAQNYQQDRFEDVARSEEAGEFTAYFETPDPARQARRNAYANHVLNMLDLGCSVEEIRTQIENRKIWDTFTPHPTKDKNSFAQAGQKVLTEGEPGQVSDTLAQMVLNPLTPRQKDTLSDETQAGLDHLATYMDGALDYLQDLQWALDHTLGDQGFDLRDTHIDLAPRDWYAGDADGKLVPAEVLFSKRLQGARGGVQKYLEILESVPKKERGPLGPTIQKFESVAHRLGEIEQDPEKLTGMGEVINDEGQIEVKPNLKIAMDKFSEAFTASGFLGLEENIGPNWTGEVMRGLREVSEDENVGSLARAAAQRATLMHKQVGVALGRQEVRHSGEDLNKIFQNLYSYLAENPGVVPDLYIKKGSRLTDLSEEQQVEFYKKFINAENRRDILRAANEGKLDGEKEATTKEVLRRFEVLNETFNKNRMGVAIIAEANPMSCIQQQILAEAFHIRGMTHCALNEDEETIKRAADNLRLYLENFGKNNLQIKMQEVQGDETHPTVHVCVMDPASDSHKSWGTCMKDAQIRAWGKVIRLGEKFGVAALMKIGTGMSYARGGFPAEVVPRLQLHALSKSMDISGLGENSRNILKRQLGMASVTIQGRGPGMLRGSRGQVQDALAKIGFEIDAACLAVDGRIDPKDIAPLTMKYSPVMKKFLGEAQQAARDHYHDFLRHEPSNVVFGESVENRHADAVSATMMALLTNVSARKASRDDGDKKKREELKNKETGTQRAIGQNIVKEWSESLYDGWFEVGTFLSKAREAVNVGTITAAQMRKFQADEIFTRHKWGNAVLSLAKADLEWGFDKIAMSKGEYTAERWSVGKVLHAYDSGYQGLDELEKRQAQIAYEALLTASHLEAFLGGFADGRSERETILGLYGENDTLEKVKFGEKTREFYPEIENIQALAQKDKLVRAMVHECERRLRDMDGQGVHLVEGSDEIQKFRHIAMARRTVSGPITLPNLLDVPKVTFGARREPLMDLIHAKADKIRVRRRTAANDSEYGAHQYGAPQAAAE